MPKRKEVELMNRFELMNEVERIRSLDRTEELGREVSRLQHENHEQNLEIERLRSQQVVIAQYFDALGREPGKEMWLDVADDLRAGQLVSPKKFERQSKRNTRDRRTQAQGRRQKARRS